MISGDRIIHRQHSEYGFGTIKYVEENVLGETRYQIAFDHLDLLLELGLEQIDLVGKPEQDVADGHWAPLELLKQRLMAALILGENNVTSAFLKTATRPLPHQVSVLDKVLSGDRFGHLFGDDVGLGKTIEAGLLITSVLTGPQSKRVLIICPAGVALQWQDEMEEHFSLYFSVLGLDFKGTQAAQWRNHPLIIAPIDRLKQPHFESILREAGPFDLAICDEAHRLNASRNMLTQELHKTQSYRLIERLVAERSIDYVNAAGVLRSPRLVFLTATPHQGDDLRFLYLLNLLRPDLFPIINEDISFLRTDLLRETVTRTPKSLARDWEGNPIFKGHSSHTVDVSWTLEETAISRMLSRYILASLSGSASSGQPNHLVVELVMHTFHKIAASSWSALTATLTQRLDLLEGRRSEFLTTVEENGGADEDGGLGTETLERAFFGQEGAALREILTLLSQLPKDGKWATCRDILAGLDREQAGCKVLFFTQYRATQRYLQERLNDLFPNCGVEIVNGDVSLIDRRLARKRFETSSRFMVSTEAGGEGVNLQKSCHLMINYDLAWNPMRMQQRIGRLDRYGQKKRVSVYNLRVPESWDARISTRIEERLSVIQRTMGEVVAGDIENYREMILGQVAERIDPASAFKEHLHGREVSVEQVDAFLQQAVASMTRWKSRFADTLIPETNLSKFNPSLTTDQFRQSYSAALDGLNLALQETRNSQQQFLRGVYHFNLPAAFRDPQIRAGREFHVVFDRDVYQKSRDEDLGVVRGQPIKINLAGFGESFTDWLFQNATRGQAKAGAYRILASTAWRYGPGWLALYSLKYLGCARRILAPDAVVGIFINRELECEIIPSTDLFSLCAEATPSEESGAVPDLTSAITLARQDLKERIKARTNNANSSIGLSLWSVVRVSERGQSEVDPIR